MSFRPHLYFCGYFGGKVDKGFTGGMLARCDFKLEGLLLGQCFILFRFVLDLNEGLDIYFYYVLFR